MAILPIILVLFVLIILIYTKRKSLLANSKSINRFLLITLIALLLLLIVWMAIMVFGVGPSMRRL